MTYRQTNTGSPSASKRRHVDRAIARLLLQPSLKQTATSGDGVIRHNRPSDLWQWLHHGVARCALRWECTAYAVIVSVLAVTPVAAASGVVVLPNGDQLRGTSDDGTSILVSGNNSGYLGTISGQVNTIPVPTGTTRVDLLGLSGDGAVVVGNTVGSTNDAFAWTIAGGFMSLAISGASTQAVGASFDGTAITGTESVSSVSHAVYWSAANGWQPQDLGTFSGSGSSQASAISRTGTTVVGSSDRSDGTPHAFVWNTTSQVLQDIDDQYDSSTALLVSADGSVVAGTGSTSTTAHRVFRWTTADGMVDVGVLNGSDGTTLNAMSSDGQVLVGQSFVSSSNGGIAHAIRYAASSAALSDLGTLGGSTSTALGVNADGSVVVGYANDASEQARAFRWTTTGGMTSVDRWLTAAGVDIGSDVFGTAQAVSSDGNTVIGTYASGEQYIARVVPDSSSSSGATDGSTPAEGPGVIETSKFLPTVSETANVALRGGVQTADTVMFGAQGEPMRDRLALGQMALKGTIDGGRDNDNANDGLGIAQLDFGYGIADGVTARLSFGGVKVRQALGLGGEVQQTGAYISPEVTADLGRDLYLTVGGYWLRGSIDSRRAYLNGADTDFSGGSTDAQTWGAKIRLDWLNAVTVQNTEITPYLAASYARTNVGAYDETTGSFPVSYDATSNHSTILRLGADFVHPLTERARLLAKMEADYQLESRTASTDGTIIGVGRFSLPGDELDHVWFRGGLGAEYDIGKGTASIMANATTQGQDPDFWIRSDWGVKF